MKTTFLFSFILIVLFSCNYQSTIAQNKKKDNIKIVKLQTSAHTVQCKAKIEKTLAYEKGIIESDFNKKTRILTVKFKSNKTDVNKIIKAITDLGHTAEEIIEENISK